MKKDGKHNLSLSRIANLHSLDLERGAQLQQDIKTAVLLSQPIPEGGGKHGDNDKLVEHMMTVPTGKNAEKWQAKFEALKKYQEEHGE